MKESKQMYETWKRDYLDGLSAQEWVERGLRLNALLARRRDPPPPPGGLSLPHPRIRISPLSRIHENSQ